MFKLNYRRLFNIDFLFIRMSIAFLLRSKTDPEGTQVHQVKQLTPQRWRQFMFQVLQKMFKEPKNEKIRNLITDLITIVQNISQTNFVQSALEIRPFKPEFIEKNYIEIDASQSTQSTVAETITKAAKFKLPLKYHQKQKKSEDPLERKQITQKTLQNQLNKSHHPYTYIIKNFSHLLELKYKNMIQKKKLGINQIIKCVKKDMEVFSEFMRLSSAPYKKLFKLEINEAEEISANKMNRFIENYVLQNTRINNSLHKIVGFAAKTLYQNAINKKIVNFDEPNNYDIPQEFKIDGCYLNSMNSLIEFCQLSSNHQKAMKKLLQFRNCILKDINQYYVSKTGSTKQLELNAQVQIEIIRFIIGKLKNWACEIFAQLKFLELIYGDEQIAYKYEYMSFMYTQLILTFQILQIN